MKYNIRLSRPYYLGKRWREGKYENSNRREDIVFTRIVSRQRRNGNSPLSSALRLGKNKCTLRKEGSWGSPQMKSKAMLLFFLLLGTTAKAAHQYLLDELKVIEVSISRQGLTRITVKEDRIVNVFGVAGEYVLEADETQGQVFIRPMGPGIFKPISLTITTEAGHTQDLRLVPKDQAPEALILNPPTQELSSTELSLTELKADKEIKAEISREKGAPLPLLGSHTDPKISRGNHPEDITRDEIEILFHACRDGRIPLGYKAMPLSLNTLYGPYLLVRKLKGEKLQCLTYEVRNTTKAPLVFSEQTFVNTLTLKKNETCPRTSSSLQGDSNDATNSAASGGDQRERIIAILMSQKTLNPGERMIVHVVTTASY